ncbi:MAG: hypothetical protein JWO95_1851 [Verrucomicrobiales bacterium]|nr:hypothetical protein [Verrucomicrobiales bacterium]
MKITSLTIVTCLIVLVSCPIHAQDTNKVSGTIGFENVPVSDVLDVYKALTKQELVISTDVGRATHGITLHTDVTSVEKSKHLIEETLLKQAGVVLTQLDNNRISVTYNDHLELQP